MECCVSVLRIFSWYLMFLCFCRMMYFYSHQMPCLTIQQTQSTSGRYFLYWFQMHVLFVIGLYNPSSSCQSLHAHVLTGPCLFSGCSVLQNWCKHGTCSVSCSVNQLCEIFFIFFAKSAPFISYHFLVTISVCELHICYKLNTLCSTVC